MTAMKIRNIHGASETTCVCGSWLVHWKKFSGQAISDCPASGCFNRNLVGAHVREGGDSHDLRWYICPLCIWHNMHPGDLEVSDQVRLVSANEKETCGR
jgi:hypothetical protein